MMPQYKRESVTFQEVAEILYSWSVHCNEEVARVNNRNINVAQNIQSL